MGLQINDSNIFSDRAKDHYDLVISIAEKFLSAAEIGVLKLGMSLRIHSAKVEMFSQMAENKRPSHLACRNFVDVGGKFTCAAEEISKLLNQVTIDKIMMIAHLWFCNKLLIMVSG